MALPSRVPTDFKTQAEKGFRAARARGAAIRARADDTRALLLTTARDLFLEAGEPGFSLREVARRVGVSPAAVYRHFDGKEALIFAACTQGFEVFSSYLVRALAAPTALERALAACEQYRNFGLENPLDYRFIFMSPAEQVQPPSPQATEPGSCLNGGPMLPQYSTFQFLVDRIRECMDAGLIARGDTQTDRRAGLGALAWLGLTAHRRSARKRSVTSQLSPKFIGNRSLGSFAAWPEIFAFFCVLSEHCSHNQPEGDRA